MMNRNKGRGVNKESEREGKRGEEKGGGTRREEE